METTKTDRLVNGFFISLCFFLILSAVFSDVIDEKVLGLTEKPEIIVEETHEKDYNKKEFIERNEMFQKVMSSIHMVGKKCDDKKIQEVYKFLKKSQLCYVDNGPHYLFPDSFSVGIQPLKTGEDIPYEISRGRQKYKIVRGLFTSRMNVILMKDVEQISILSTVILVYHEGYHALLHQNKESMYYECGIEEAIVRGLELKIMRQLYGKPFEDFLVAQEKKIKFSDKGVECFFWDSKSYDRFLKILNVKKSEFNEMSGIFDSFHYLVVIDLIDKNVWDKDNAMRLKAREYYKMFGKF